MKNEVIENMPIEDYNAAPGVRQSNLKLMAKSALHCHYAEEHPDNESTPDMDMGTVLHCAVFEPNRLNSCCYVKPSTYPHTDKGVTTEKPWNGNANFCKDWLKEHKGRIIIPQETYGRVMQMRDAVLSNPDVALAMKGKGRFELSMFAEEAVILDAFATIRLQLKCRPDYEVGNAFIDLKKCRDASAEGFAKSVINFGYDVQAHSYLNIADSLGSCLPRRIEHFLFIAVEDEPPFANALYELNLSSLLDGRSKYTRWLRRYAECVRDNNWPGYPRGVQYLDTPAWAKRFEQNQIQLEDSPRESAAMA